MWRDCRHGDAQKMALFPSFVKKVSLGENLEKCQKWKRLFAMDNRALEYVHCNAYPDTRNHSNISKIHTHIPPDMLLTSPCKGHFLTVGLSLNLL